MSRSPDYERGEGDTWAAQGFPPGYTVPDVVHLMTEYGVVSPISGDKTTAFAAGANRDLEGPDK